MPARPLTQPARDDAVHVRAAATPQPAQPPDDGSRSAIVGASVSTDDGSSWDSSTPFGRRSALHSSMPVYSSTVSHSPIGYDRSRVSRNVSGRAPGSVRIHTSVPLVLRSVATSLPSLI